MKGPRPAEASDGAAQGLRPGHRRVAGDAGSHMAEVLFELESGHSEASLGKLQGHELHAMEQLVWWREAGRQPGHAGNSEKDRIFWSLFTDK